MALAALSVAVLFVLSVSQPARADNAAPFGLTWGMTLEAVEAMTAAGAEGAEVRPLFTDGPETRVTVRKLPKMLSDMELAILSFGADNRLQKIDARSVDFRYDQDGARLKARYNDLSRVLTGKYGKGEVHHDIFVTWRKPSDFLMGIYRGDSVYYTTFSGKEVDVRLEIRATRRIAGHYRLVFDYKGIRDRENGLSKEREVL